MKKQIISLMIGASLFASTQVVAMDQENEESQHNKKTVSVTGKRLRIGKLGYKRDEGKDLLNIIFKDFNKEESLGNFHKISLGPTKRILSFLDIPSLLNMSETSKLFYMLCGDGKVDEMNRIYSMYSQNLFSKNIDYTLSIKAVFQKISSPTSINDKDLTLTYSCPFYHESRLDLINTFLDEKSTITFFCRKNKEGDLAWTAKFYVREEKDAIIVKSEEELSKKQKRRLSNLFEEFERYREIERSKYPSNFFIDFLFPDINRWVSLIESECEESKGEETKNPRLLDTLWEKGKVHSQAENFKDETPFTGILPQTSAGIVKKVKQSQNHDSSAYSAATIKKILDRFLGELPEVSKSARIGSSVKEEEILKVFVRFYLDNLSKIWEIGYPDFMWPHNFTIQKIKDLK